MPLREADSRAWAQRTMYWIKDQIPYLTKRARLRGTQRNPLYDGLIQSWCPTSSRTGWNQNTQQGRHAAAMRPLAKLVRTLVPFRLSWAVDDKVVMLLISCCSLLWPINQNYIKVAKLKQSAQFQLHRNTVKQFINNMSAVLDPDYPNSCHGKACLYSKLASAYVVRDGLISQ